MFQQLQQQGWDYVLNLETCELHKIRGGQLDGSHNLATANLEDFIWLINMGDIPIDLYCDGTEILVYDIQTGKLLGSFTLNKCKHCFPSSF
ncbi:MAG: hypothetical protein LBU65_17330 [Planctomycetaceae bacterium]|nr:hypothetical protein [Planctomycetaceae bacterium]